MNTRKPKILIIYTGGTIGMIENPETGALQPFDFSHLMDNVPKVKKLDYEIDNFQFVPPIDSSNMDPTHWRDIALAIEENYDRFDGFVVLHGTDTMAFTASALSFMLENLSKPVIITGSQLPIGEVRTDGEENLITALQVAAARNEKEGRPRVQEVAILFENYLWRGNRATKMSADNFNAFKSFNYPELAEIGLDIEYNTNSLRDMPPGELNVCTEMDTNVMFLELNPGMTEQTLDYLLHTPGIKGIVLKTYGAGNSPSYPWFIKKIREAVERGIVIVNVTQCVNGGVNCNLYETGNSLSAAGVISGYDITSEAAITKLMFLFGRKYPLDMVKQLMVTDLCGEITSPFDKSNLKDFTGN